MVKISDFGLYAFKADVEEIPDMKVMNAKLQKLLYRAPELLRCGPASTVPGSVKGDSYSFGIILYELHTRQGPYGDSGYTPAECLKKIIHPPKTTPPFRPSFQPLESSFDCVREILKECWQEKPEDRPDFKTIRAKLRPLRKGMRANIFDNMMVSFSLSSSNYLTIYHIHIITHFLLHRV